MSVIANTTVLSNFAILGRLDLLRQLFGQLYLTLEVYEEIRAGLEEGYEFYRGFSALVSPVSSGGWLQLTGVAAGDEVAIFSRMPRKLHAGEASSLAIASHRGWLFLTDDKAARRHARHLGVDLSGSLGCLAAAVEAEICDLARADAWLRRLVAAGFRSPVESLADLIP